MLYRLDRTRIVDGHPLLVEVPPSELAYDAHRRRVIMFPGYAVYSAASKDTFEKRVGGCVKCIEHTLEPAEPREPPVDIYVYVYRDHSLPTFGFDAFSAIHGQRNGDMKIPSGLAKSLGDNVMLPLLLKGDERLEDLPADEVKKRLSHLTLVGHSMGTVVDKYAEHYVTQRLQQTRPLEEVEQIMPNLTAIDVASVARRDLPGPTASQVFFTALNDKSATRGISDRDACGYGPLAPEHENKCIAIGPHRYEVRGHMPRTLTWNEKKSGGTVETRSITSGGAGWMGDDVEHDYRTFLRGVPEIGQLLRTIMRNAVTREVGEGIVYGPIRRWKKLLQPIAAQQEVIAR